MRHFIKARVQIKIQYVKLMTHTEGKTNAKHVSENTNNHFYIMNFVKRSFRYEFVDIYNSYLDWLKNIIGNNIFWKWRKVEICVWFKYCVRTHPIFDKIQNWCLKTNCNAMMLFLLQFLCNFWIHKFWAYWKSKICVFSIFKLCFGFICWWGVAICIWNFWNMFWIQIHNFENYPFILPPYWQF